MSGGDLLYIFSFLILPTILLVSCIWMWILLRKGILLPTPRLIVVEDDQQADERDAVAVTSPTNAAVPVIAMHVARADDDALASQQTVEFEIWRAEQVQPDESTLHAEPTTVALPAEGDAGTEAMPVQREEIGKLDPDVTFEPITASDIVNDDVTLPDNTAPLVEPEISSTPELFPTDAEPPTIIDLSEEVFEPNSADADDAPVGLPETATEQPEPASTLDSTGVLSPEYDPIQITDEHPIVEFAPAAASIDDVAGMSAPVVDREGVAKPHANPRAVPAGRRKQIRRPEERLKPALFRKSRGSG